MTSESHSDSNESPPRRPQYPVPASLDDDVGSRAKGGVPKRSKPSKTVPLEEQHLARLLAPQEPYLRARYETMRKRSLPQQTRPTRLRFKTATSSETRTSKHNLNKLGPPLVVLNKAHQTQMVPHLNQLGPPLVVLSGAQTTIIAVPRRIWLGTTARRTCCC